MALQTVCPLPTREAVRQLYNVLLGCQVTVDRGKVSLQPHLGVPMVVADYVVEGGRIAAVGLWDLPLAASSAAALAMMPATTVGECQTAGRLDDDLLELFHEVANITTKLFNSASTPHIVLRGVQQAPASLPRDTRALVAAPVARLDYDLGVEGFADGVMSLLAW